MNSIDTASAPILTAEQQLQGLIAARDKAAPEIRLEYDGVWEDDHEFYAAAANFASTAGPQLLSKLKRMQEALEFYADGFIPYQGPGGEEDEPVFMPKPETIDDGGKIARKVLEEQ